MNSQYYKNETLNMSLKYKDFKLLSHNLFICSTTPTFYAPSQNKEDNAKMYL